MRIVCDAKNTLITYTHLFTDIQYITVEDTHVWDLGFGSSEHTLSTLSVTSLGDRRMRTLIFVYIIEEVAHAHEQNTLLEWFS